LSCVAVSPTGQPFPEDVLPEDVHRALDDHVAGCPMRRLVTPYLATPRILREATAATLSTDLKASLKAFLRAQTTAFRSN